MPSSIPSTPATPMNLAAEGSLPNAYKMPVNALRDLELWVKNAPDGMMGKRDVARNRILDCMARQDPELDLFMKDLTDLPPRHLSFMISHIKAAFLSNNRLDSIDFLPATLEILCITDNRRITQLPTLRDMNQLRHLFADINSLSSIDFLPATLQKIDLRINCLTQLPTLSHLNQLTALLVGTNELSSIDGLPETLEILDITMNKLTQWPSLPSSLKYINVSDNLLKDLPASLPEMSSQLSITMHRNPLSENAQQQLAHYKEALDEYQGPQVYWTVPGSGQEFHLYEADPVRERREWEIGDFIRAPY